MRSIDVRGSYFEILTCMTQMPVEHHTCQAGDGWGLESICVIHVINSNRCRVTRMPDARRTS